MSPSRSSAASSAGNVSVATAGAVRRVTALSPTLTIVGRFCASTCEKLFDMTARRYASHPGMEARNVSRRKLRLVPGQLDKPIGANEAGEITGRVARIGFREQLG